MGGFKQQGFLVQVGGVWPEVVSLEAERPGGLIQRYMEALQLRHYARRTMSSYGQWLGRFLGFHQMRHLATCDTLCHSFARHLLEQGANIALFRNYSATGM